MTFVSKTKRRAPRLLKSPSKSPRKTTAPRTNQTLRKAALIIGPGVYVHISDALTCSGTRRLTSGQLPSVPGKPAADFRDRSSRGRRLRRRGNTKRSRRHPRVSEFARRLRREGDGRHGGDARASPEAVGLRRGAVIRRYRRSGLGPLVRRGGSFCGGGEDCASGAW